MRKLEVELKSYEAIIKKEATLSPTFKASNKSFYRNKLDIVIRESTIFAGFPLEIAPLILF